MIAELPMPAIWAIFAACAAVIGIGGTAMTRLADIIADRTGLGEATTGGILLGAATSLSGSVVSITAALDGRASLAFSNGVGGIAAQTAFLALADVVHRRANLEHAAAELANVFQCGLLILLLTLPFVAVTSPEFTVFAVHPVSFAILGVYLAGAFAAQKVHDEPMWRPIRTEETRVDAPEDDEEPNRSVKGPALKFAGLMAVLGCTGWVLANAAGVIIDELGISGSIVGALMTATVTSLPELVTTIAAVRRGALQLAVGGIIGGNTFDTLFLVASDMAYREGSLYHNVDTADLFWVAIGLVLNGILLIGLLMREKRGTGNIGFESLNILLIYVGAVALRSLVG